MSRVVKSAVFPAPSATVPLAQFPAAPHASPLLVLVHVPLSARAVPAQASTPAASTARLKMRLP